MLAFGITVEVFLCKYRLAVGITVEVILRKYSHRLVCRERSTELQICVPGVFVYPTDTCDMTCLTVMAPN
jgi:hypothetical protein